jgi:hypothetical protein
MSPSRSRAHRRVLIVSVVLAGAALPAVAAAQDEPPEPKSPAAARALKDRGRAYELINAAERHVAHARAGCLFAAPTGPTRFTHDVPGAEMTGALSALRRPQTDADRVTRDGLLGGIGGEVYVDYTRTVTAADGEQYVLVPGRATDPEPRPASCAAAVRSRLLRVTRTERRRVRAFALREYAHIARDERRAAARPRGPYDQVFLFDRAADGRLGGGGGGGPFGRVLTHGSVGTSGTDDRTAMVRGVVPDGVATVTMTFPKRESRGPYYKPRVFPRRVVVTAPVRENVFSVRVPRSAPDAFASRTVWRAADGHVLRVVGR